MDTLREILSDINKDPSSIKKHINNNYLRNFMEVAYIPEKKVKLPEGLPKDIRYSTLESDIQTKGIMWQFLRKVNLLNDEKIKQLRREVMFVDALEHVTKPEAEVLLHMKEQTLDVLYPNINLKVLTDHGYFPK